MKALTPHILRDEFSELLGEISIDVEDGWLPLLYDLCEDLEILIDDGIICGCWDAKTLPMATAVDKRNGYLFFSLSYETAEMSRRIVQAKNQSTKVCELCGKRALVEKTGEKSSPRCVKCRRKYND